MGLCSHELRVEVRKAVAADVIRLVLVDPSGADLPRWTPGAHIDLAHDGVVRQYSLCGDPASLASYEVAVLKSATSRGGSVALHRTIRVGSLVAVSGPRNNFTLEDADSYLFLAGGIGITPLLPMLRRVEARPASWRLVYGGRTREHMAFVDDLVEAYGPKVDVVAQDERGLPDLAAEIASVPDGALVYACGPEGMLRACEGAASDAGRRRQLRLERFGRREDVEDEATPFEVELASSGTVLDVPLDRCLLDVLLEAGVDLDYSCREGTCGTCETSVLAGEVDHRDAVLTDDEREAGDVMFVCVSRARTPRLVLDL
jgi:ferredoxin-NADP reductase